VFSFKQWRLSPNSVGFTPFRGPQEVAPEEGVAFTVADMAVQDCCGTFMSLFRANGLSAQRETQ